MRTDRSISFGNVASAVRSFTAAVLTRSVFVHPLCFVLVCAAASAQQQQAARACDFIDSIGVDTHFGYVDTTYYQRPADTIRAIQSLGVRHMRDGLAYAWVAPHLYSIYAQLAQAGIHSDLIVPNPLHNGPSADAIERLLPNYPGVDAIESPNEYDQAKNPNWIADLRAYLPVLQQVAADTKLPLIGPSLTQPASYPALGDVSAFENFANLHAYWGGRNPETGGWGGPDAQGHAYGSFAYDFDKLNMTSSGKPVFMTESGYVAGEEPKRNVIPETVEAVYLPRLVLHAWNLGIRRTYIYELMDEPSSTPGFGLMHKDLTPRPAYTALATLTRLLADKPGPQQAGMLSYTIQGDMKGLETTLLEKQDGSFWLAIWNQSAIYEVNELHSLPVAPRTVTLTVAARKNIRAVWAFDETGQASQKALKATTTALDVGSAITLIEID